MWTFLTVGIALWLGGCAGERAALWNMSASRQPELWDIGAYPPSEVLENSGGTPALRDAQATAARSCAALGDSAALKLISYDDFGDFAATGSAVALRWRGKTVYLTNRHKTDGRGGFFLTNDRGNWVEARVAKASGNIFDAARRQDDLAKGVAVDLALLEPVSPGKLAVEPRPLYAGKTYRGPVAAMGYPEGGYRWTMAEAFSGKDYLVVYGEAPFYSQSGASGGGVYACDTGDLVGLTFSTPFLPFVVNPKTRKFHQVKKVKDLKHGRLVAQYAIHAFQIEAFLREAAKAR